MLQKHRSTIGRKKMALKVRLQKHRNSLVRIWLKRLGFPHNRYASQFLEGTYLEPSEVTFAAQHKVFYFGKYIYETLPLESLGECFSGRELAVIGSGPSINALDLDKLAGMDTVLLNGAISLIQSHKVAPTLIVIIDATFCSNRFELLQKVPKGTPLLLSFTAMQRVLLLQEDFLKDYPVYLVHFSPLTERRYRQPDFLIDELDDLHRGVQDGGTVMSTALQCAVALKWSQRIYLLGLDIGNAGQPRFNESAKTRLRSGLLHDYEEKILPFMGLLAKHAGTKQIELYNCSPISKLPFSVIPYSSCFETAASGEE